MLKNVHKLRLKVHKSKESSITESDTPIQYFLYIFEKDLKDIFQKESKKYAHKIYSSNHLPITITDWKNI